MSIPEKDLLLKVESLRGADSSVSCNSLTVSAQLEFDWSPKPGSHLFMGLDFAALERGLFYPWIRGRSEGAWANELPTVVVVPTRTLAHYLREGLARREQSVAGVRIWTLTDLRAWLRRHLTPQSREARRDEAELLLSLAALDVIRSEDSPIARSVSMSPGALLSSVEALLSAGHGLEQLPLPIARSMVRRWASLLGAAGFCTRAQADLAIRAATENADVTLFRALCLLGFDARHWASWPLLQAASRSAADLTVGLVQPTVAAEQLDALWISGWEEFTGAVGLFVDAESDAGLSETEAPRECPLDFLVSESPLAEARRVANEVVALLAGEADTESSMTPAADDGGALRIGIVVPGRGAVSRELAHYLSKQGIPIHDGLGFFTPGLFEDSKWRAWLELVEQPGLDQLQSFAGLLSAGDWRGLCETVEIEFPGLTAIRKRLDRFAADTMLTDLRCLAVWCRRQPDVASQVIARVVEVVAGQHAEGQECRSLEDWFAFADEALNAIGWSDCARLVADRARGLSSISADEVPAPIFVAWLRQSCQTQSMQRPPEARHFFASVHILLPEEAELQSWSHLFLTSCTQEAWPSQARESTFLARGEIDELNRRIMGLNRSKVVEGSQGAGHEVMRSGMGVCLGPAQRQALRRRSLTRLRESVSGKLVLSLHRRAANEPERLSTPASFFAEWWLEGKGEPLTEASIELLASASAVPAGGVQVSITEPVAAGDEAELSSMDTAYRARRSAQPFGRFEFALEQAGSDDTAQEASLVLSCGEWENALARPASVWLKRMLGVEALRARREMVGPQAVGHWVHEWLAAANISTGRVCHPMPEEAERDRRIALAADNRLASIEIIAREAGVEISEAWLSDWRRARSLALELAQALQPEDSLRHLASEVSLPRRRVEFDFSSDASLGNSEPGEQALRGALRLAGRVDALLLADAEWPESLWPDGPLCVIDFKTGKEGKDDLRFDKGKSVQLLLYGLYLDAVGAREINLCVYRGGGVSKLKEFVLGEREQYLLVALARIEQSGVLGWHGAFRDEFSYTPPYPLATVSVDKALLALKWQLTHPGLEGVV